MRFSLLMSVLLAVASPAGAQGVPPAQRLPPAEEAAVRKALAPRPGAGRAPVGYAPGLFAGEHQALAQAVLHQRRRTIRRLVGQHPDWLAYQEPAFGWTPLTFAVWNGRRRAAAELLRLGADPNNRSLRNGQTPLIEALDGYRYSDPMVRLLLAHGADPNRPAEIIPGATAYETPLAAAIGARHLAAARQLVQAGANPQYPTHEGYSLLLQAAYSRHPEIVAYCVQELRVDFSQPVRTIANHQPVYLADELREWHSKPGSKRQQQIAQLQGYLQAHGSKP